ncbi:MAG TPA: HD-GYP domain-containing protein [Solirubrobacteraceae bacterium]|nr:HD-GYP domain-containing protein [Solirubrobacteraceae bacterium]
MSLEPSQAEQKALAQTLQRDAARMNRRERISALIAGGLFAVAEAGLLTAGSPGTLKVIPALLSLGVLTAAFRVRIDLPLGFTVPSQLAFVPLLWVVPAALVPVFALAALVLQALVDVARGRLKLARVLNMPGNACFALGPAAVFVIAGTAPRSAGALVWVAALAAQFAVDFVISVVRQAIAHDVSLTEQLAETWVYAVDAGLSCVGVVVAEQSSRTPVAVLALLPLLAMLAVFARERRARLESMLELGNAYRGTALVLGDMVEADDGYTGEHCKSVVTLALAVGAELGLPHDRERNLEFGALLHDVGKIAIPKDIINKAGSLDAREWTIIKTHTLEGQKMLDRVGGFMREVGLIVRSHHERWDGTGYPDGLAGREIPIESRIIACCDAWNAMRTDRAYRKALSHDQALAEMRSASGTQFDPDVVRALLRVVAEDAPAPRHERAVAPEPDAPPRTPAPEPRARRTPPRTPVVGDGGGTPLAA